VRLVPATHPSQRSLHNAPIFRLLLKVAVNGTHQCDFLNFCGDMCAPTNGCQSGLLAVWNELWPSLAAHGATRAQTTIDLIAEVVPRPEDLRSLNLPG